MIDIITYLYHTCFETDTRKVKNDRNGFFDFKVSFIIDHFEIDKRLQYWKIKMRISFDVIDSYKRDDVLFNCDVMHNYGHNTQNVAIYRHELRGKFVI